MVRNVWGLLATFLPPGATYVGEKSWASPAPTLSHYTHLWSPVGPERREGWVLMQQKRPMSGERQTCTESTWKQSNVLSLRVSHGQGPRSVCYNNSDNNMLGSMCSSATITRHCYDTGDTSGNKTDEIPALWGSLSSGRGRKLIFYTC